MSELVTALALCATCQVLPALSAWAIHPSARAASLLSVPATAGFSGRRNQNTTRKPERLPFVFGCLGALHRGRVAKTLAHAVNAALAPISAAQRRHEKCPHQESNLGCRGHDATS